MRVHTTVYLDSSAQIHQQQIILAQHKCSNVNSVGSPVARAERMTPGHWLVSK